MVTKRKSSSSPKKKSVSKKSKPIAESSNNADVVPPVDAPSRRSVPVVNDDEDGRFIGEPLPVEQAINRWPHRYQSKENTITIPANGSVPEKVINQAKRHYTEALVDGRVLFKLGDDGYVYAGEGKENYICRIVEMFEGRDGVSYFCAQWFYRAKDTIIEVCSNLIDDRRIFLSEVRDDNPLGCLLEKLKIVRVPLDRDQATKRALLGDGDYYYDMSYLIPYSSYQNLPPDNETDGNESDSTISSDSDTNAAVPDVLKTEDKKTEMKMLDLYSGCGAMSTGLCLGANIGKVNLVTRWSVDFNKYACESLKLNHPETEVRNVPAEDYLMLLIEWLRLCQSFSLVEGGDLQLGIEQMNAENDETENAEDDDEVDEEETLDEEIFEVEKVLDICYGDPKETKIRGLYLKVH